MRHLHEDSAYIEDISSCLFFMMATDCGLCEVQNKIVVGLYTVGWLCYVLGTH